MAISRGTVSSLTDDTGANDIALTHTVDTNTTLLVVTGFLPADETSTTVPQWSGGGGENLVLVDATTSSGVADDVRLYTWALHNPTAGVAGSITWDFSDTVWDAAISAVNYLGTHASAGIEFRYENVRDVGAEPDNIFLSSTGQTAGRTLYGVGIMQGGDASPASPNNSFNLLVDDKTSADTTGFALVVVDKLAGAVTGCTISMSATDSIAGQMFEIIPEGGLPQIMHNRQQVNQ